MNTLCHDVHCRSRAVLCAALLIAGAGTAGAASNLLVNGDFETGSLAGWSVQGAALSTNAPRAGDYAVEFAGSASIDQTFSTISGQTYKATAWLRIVSETGSDWGGFTISVTDYQSWQSLGESPSFTEAEYGTNWFKHAFTFTAIANSSRISLQYFGGTNRQMVVHADDIGIFDRSESNALPVVMCSLSPTVITSLPSTQTFACVGDDPDGAISLFDWEFGDGSLSQDPAGARRVGIPGVFTARVRVADDDHGVVETTFVWTATSPDWPFILITNVSVAQTATVQGIASGSGLTVRFSTDREVCGAAAGTSNWTAQVPLKSGWNRILAQAHQTNGLLATDEWRVRYEPPDPLAFGPPTLSQPNVQRWEPIEVSAALLNSAATHPAFPYATNYPPVLDFIDGVTVDAVFSPDGGATEFRVPAFLHQRYRIEERENYEWMMPTGAPAWTARFAPPRDGMWSVRLEAEESKGAAISVTLYFDVIAPSNPLNRGPIHPSTNDWRFYEFADGTPFLGNGFGLGAFDRDRFSLNASNAFDQIGIGNADYFRFWAAGLVWGNSWQPWSSRTRPAEGTVPAYMLSLDSAYGEALGAFKLDVNPANWSDPAFNPLVFQGFNGESASLEPGKTYRIRVRWRTENLTGPAAPGPYGVVVKFTDWPEPGQTTNEPAIIAHVHGDTPWHVAWGDFVADRHIARNLVIALENVTGGRAFVDECAVHEVYADGSLSPPLNGLPRFAQAHLGFNPRRGAGLDVIYREAQSRGLYIRTVISEKQEWAMNHLAPSGLRDRRAVHFNTPNTNAPTVRLHESYWRHLAARFGAFRSFQGIEFVNEEAPGPTDHFRLLGHLARWWHAQANPKPVSSSTWFGLAENAWKADFAADADATDFHAYTVGNWLFPDEDPAIMHDSANYYHAFSESWLAANFGKPGHWGEASIYTTNFGEHPMLANDTNGVWLHKWIWARSGPAFVYPSYWYTDNIWTHNLHGLFGNWNRFMAGVPLSNSRYTDAAATSSVAQLRLAGQKDIPAGHAYLWIDNRSHTWWHVVNTQAVPAVTGDIELPMLRSNAVYEIVWYRTTNGLPYRTNLAAAAANGVLTLGVTNLATDTALHLRLIGESAWDGDGDGLPDQWEARYVRRLSDISAAGDHDGDGVADFDEYIAGTSPIDPLDRLTIQPGLSVLSWPSVSGRLYRVEFSSNLATWAIASGDIAASVPTNTHPIAPEGFYRISVRRDP